MKRTKQKMKKISEIDYLLKFLYFSEENYVVYNNGIINLKLRMDQNCNLKIKVMEDPKDKETLLQLKIPVLFEIIKQLKEMKTSNLAFSNEWERIVAFVKLNIDLTE